MTDTELVYEIPDEIMGNIYKLPLILEPQPEDGYTITCPLLPNLITEADTLEEVIPNVSDALSALIEAYQDLGQTLPLILRCIKDLTVLITRKKERRDFFVTDQMTLFFEQGETTVKT